jgi:hypothetical protein
MNRESDRNDCAFVGEISTRMWPPWAYEKSLSEAPAFDPVLIADSLR